MEESIGSFAKQLKEDISKYIDLRIEYTKILFYEKISNIIGASTASILIAFFAFFTFLFLSITTGFYLGVIFESNAIGFAFVTAFYLLILFVIYINRNRIKESVANKFAEVLTNDDDERSTN